MLTERMRQLINEITELPAEGQDRVVEAIQVVLRRPAVNSDSVRPEVMAESPAVLEYLRDR